MSYKTQRKWSALLAAAFFLSNVQAAALARDTQIISPPMAGAADAMKIRKAFQLESDPLVSLVHKDVSVEFILRGLAQKANLSLIYMVDGASGSSSASPAAAVNNSGGEEDPLMQLQRELDTTPAAATNTASAGNGARGMVIPYLELKDVPVSEAFALVLQMSGLVGRRVYNSLLITTPDKMTKMGFSSPVIKTYTIYNQAATAAVLTGGGANATGGGAAANSPLITQLKTIYTSRGITPAPDILLDQRTSTLVVIGTQEAIDIADHLVPVLDRALPQVVVEVKLIELNKRASQELGVSYGFAQDKTAAGFNNATATGPGNPITGDGESIISFSSLSRFAPNFNARLNALVRDGQARVMSSPRLTIQHGVLATFDSTTQFPVISTTTTATTATQSVQAINIGERVSITPFIDTEQNMITMKLTPDISTRGAVVTVLTNGQPQTIPEVNTRRVDTTLRVPDGESVIIGGLMRKSDTEQTSKIPLLGDIPILGALFSTTEKTQEEVEIVIMVTPRILKAE